MSSDELDPALEAATQEFISVSKNISDAIAIEARGSARYKKSIAISLDWPARLPKHPLSEQIAQHIAAAHKLWMPRSVVPNEAAALSFYQQDFLSACNVTVGDFLPHGAALLDGRTQRTVVKKTLDALLPESELELHARGGAEIPGIDLKRAAGVIRYGHAHKVPIPKIVFWFQQEWPWHAIVTEVREGGLPPGYPMEPEEGPELGGHGPQIAEVLRHSIDSDLGLDLSRIANWMETGRWALEVSPGKIIEAISEHGEKPSSRFAVPLVELFWLFGRPREMGAWRRSLRDSLQFELQNLADDAIMRPPEFESESELVEPADASGIDAAEHCDSETDEWLSTLEAEPAPAPDPVIEDPIDDDQVDASSAVELVGGETTATPQELEAAATPSASKARTKSPSTVEEIEKTEGKDKVVQLYNLLKRLRRLPNVDKDESALRTKFGEAFKPLWDAIDQCKTLTAKDRKDFFRQNAKEFERYEFIAKILGSTQAAVRSLRFPRKPKAKKSRKTKRKKHA